jgi:hypothetical protein
MGDSAGEIHLSSARIINGQHLAQPDEAPRNQSNYRIGEHDKIGDGSIRQKGKNNLQAIRLVRALEGETRAARNQRWSNTSAGAAFLKSLTQAVQMGGKMNARSLPVC